MNKVLIDRELLERVQERLDPHRDAVLWGDVCDTFRSAPSGTPGMPVKAYYHEAPNEYGGLNKSVGLEVRKEFTDAPLVLEADALARVACLEGEIAKQDARIAELEARYQRDVYGLNNEGDPIGGEPAGGYANDNARLRAELAAIKAQGVVMPERAVIREVFMRNGFTIKEGQADLKSYVYAAAEELLRLNAAPVVSGRNTMDAGVCVTDCRSSDGVAVGIIDAVITLARVFNGREVTPAVEEALIDLRADEDVISMISFTPVVSGQGVPDGYVLVPVELIEHVKHARKELCRLETAPLRIRQKLAQKLTDLLAAAPAAPAADAGLVDMYRHLQKVTPYRFKKIQDASITDGGDVMYFHKDRFDAALLADMAAHCAAKGVV